MEKTSNSYLSPNCVTNLFGTLPDGKKVYSYTLANTQGMEVTVINYGATITSLKVPSVNGAVDVVLGFDTIEKYIDSFGLPSGPYYGSVIGRYAGRISNAAFTLNGETFKLNANNNGNALHGGNIGFGRAYWQMKQIKGGDKPSIVFTYTSKDGEENFPGNLAIDVEYTITENNELVVSYKATTDKATVLNLTQHSYFNLGGHSQSLAGQQVQVNTDKILDVTEGGIPTGSLTDVNDTRFDFRGLKEIPQQLDNSFVLSCDYDKEAAVLENEGTGLKMRVFTNQPSVHIYVGGNCFGQIAGKEGSAYTAYSGICFETQNYPDAPNRPEFPSSVLNPGETYRQETKYKFEKL